MRTGVADDVARLFERAGLSVDVLLLAVTVAVAVNDEVAVIVGGRVPVALADALGGVVTVMVGGRVPVALADRLNEEVAVAVGTGDWESERVAEVVQLCVVVGARVVVTVTVASSAYPMACSPVT